MKVAATARGQALVLFAFTLLLLVLMVVFTLCLGMKVKEKIELQTLADSGAYSNAVATARTYNSLAVINRTEVALNVASIGGESLISWTTMVRAGAGETRLLLGDLQANGPAGCQSAQLSLDIAALLAQENAALATWDALDTAAGAAVRGVNSMEAAIQGTGTVVGADPTNGSYAPRNQKHERLVAGLGGAPRLIDRIISGANLGVFGLGIRASQVTNAINAREIDRGGTVGATCDDWLPSCQRSSMNQWELAMGSRGESFVTGRGVSAPIQRKLNALLQAAGVAPRVTATVGPIVGSAYWWNVPATIHGADVEGSDRHADDHADAFQVRANYPGCRQLRVGRAWDELHSANLARVDLHRWSGGADADSGSVTGRHTLISPIGNGNWPLTTDYNLAKLSNAGDLFGQPKNYVLVERDLGQRLEDPWQLKLTAKLSTGPASQFDAQNVRQLAAGALISKDAALAAGMAYYHRNGDWQEGPNLLNPFWRATLVPMDIDKENAPNDVALVLGSTGAGADAVYDQLTRAGFRGIH